MAAGAGRQYEKGRMRTSDGGLSDSLGKGASEWHYTTACVFRARPIQSEGV